MKPLYFILKVSLSACLTKLMIFSALYAQTKIHTNMPRLMKVGQPYEFKLSVKGNGKGSIAVYELKGSPELSITCDKVKGARILSVGDRIRVEFANVNDITIETQQLNFTVVSEAKGTFSVTHFVLYEGEKEDVVRNFNPSVIKVAGETEKFESETGFTTINEANADGTVMEEKMVYSDPAAIKQHLLQLYSDSREINAVGESELNKAHARLDNSNVEVRLVEYLDEGHTKKKIMGYVMMDRKKALDDIQLARNIIIVGKSLELDAESYKTWLASQESAWKNDDIMMVQEYNPLGSEGVTYAANNKLESLPENTSSICYRIQVGAFKKHRPDKNRFSNLGSVDIVKENGWYKVLLGNYKSKEEAMSYRENVVSNGFDAFVASYLNGKRML